MATGGTVEELHAEVDALVGAIVAHNALIAGLEQQLAEGHGDRRHMLDVIGTHRDIVEGHITEVRLLREEIAFLIPEQRRP